MTATEAKPEPRRYYVAMSNEPGSPDWWPQFGDYSARVVDDELQEMRRYAKDQGDKTKFKRINVMDNDPMLWGKKATQIFAGAPIADRKQGPANYLHGIARQMQADGTYPAGDCAACKKPLPDHCAATSRFDSVTPLCSACALAEALGNLNPYHSQHQEDK